ncbi:MAG: glucosaminidase domain-containing protein, partial [Candidatus Diapherotrites archaeon]|nr:glucosaminidase domain-containing protein [Candidatus Diapherotrites archaeon]
VHRNASPKVAAYGSAFYDICIEYDIDPSFAVAVGYIEQLLGKAKSSAMRCNNLFSIEYSGTEEQSGRCPYNKRWGMYKTVGDAIRHFCKLIKQKYVARGQDTPEKIACSHNDYRKCFVGNCYCCDTEKEHDYWIAKVTEVRNEIRSWKQQKQQVV